MFSASIAISMATAEQVGRHLNLHFGREACTFGNCHCVDDKTTKDIKW